METLLKIYNTYVVNILDVLILSYVFYRIILMIKGTRAIQILLGILALLALTIIAGALHLRGITWLLNRFWFAAVIIFAVVFQTEIRNLLAQIGGYLSGNAAKVKDAYIDEIVAAAEDLSAYMAGGLIAIESEVGLKNFSETGVMVNANISKELLLSIFKNKSAPLHDGAVIISNGKIYAAGCLLPLSNNMEVKIYGTRHRAALGLSEVTDAVIVVVSEETGQISIAYKGKLKSHISSSRLREVIATNGGVLKNA